MTDNAYTLTTIGLAVRDELLFKSMLRVANTQTTSRWMFRDDTRVDVALYDSASGMTAPALAQRSDAGSAVVVALPRGDAKTDATGQWLRGPTRISSLIKLLDEISAKVAGTTRPAVDGAPVAGAFRFGIALRHLLAGAGRGIYRVQAQGIEIFVAPATRSLMLKQPLLEQDIEALVNTSDEIRTTVLAQCEADRLAADGAQPHSIEWLLWRAGLEGPDDQLLCDLPADAAFMLRRWPDFGQMKQTRAQAKAHLRMAALLTRADHTIDELVAAVDVAPRHVRAFLNACALCGLVQRHARNPVAQPRNPARLTGRSAHAAIFRSIRNALGLGGG